MQRHPPEFTRASEVARRVGLDRRTLVAAVERGELSPITPVRIGQTVLYRTAAVEEFMAGNVYPDGSGTSSISKAGHP